MFYRTKVETEKTIKKIKHLRVSRLNAIQIIGKLRPLATQTEEAKLV